MEILRHRASADSLSARFNKLTNGEKTMSKKTEKKITKSVTTNLDLEQLGILSLKSHDYDLLTKDVSQDPVAIRKAFISNFVKLGQTDSKRTTTAYTATFGSFSSDSKDITSEQKSIKSAFDSAMSTIRTVEAHEDTDKVKSAIAILRGARGVLFTGSRTEEETKKIDDAKSMCAKYGWFVASDYCQDTKKEIAIVKSFDLDITGKVNYNKAKKLGFGDQPQFKDQREKE